MMLVDFLYIYGLLCADNAIRWAYSNLKLRLNVSLKLRLNVSIPTKIMNKNFQSAASKKICEGISQQNDKNTQDHAETSYLD